MAAELKKKDEEIAALKRAEDLLQQSVNSYRANLADGLYTWE